MVGKISKKKMNFASGSVGRREREWGVHVITTVKVREEVCVYAYMRT